jgi:hypothetical protein
MRDYIDEKAYGPAAVRLLCLAFDDCWEEVGSKLEVGDPRREPTRRRLARAVLETYAENRNVERDELAERALARYRNPPSARASGT